jgi:CRP-like cAMP-binding protein
MITNPNLATSLAFYGQVLQVPEGSVIFEPGERADGAYVVRSGRVDVLLLNDQGEPVWSWSIAEYGIVDLSAGIGRHPHHVRAVATSHSELVFISTETFNRVIAEDPTLGSQVLELISEELRDIRNKAAMLKARFGRKSTR